MPRKCKTVKRPPPVRRARQSQAARSTSIASLIASADSVSSSAIPSYHSTSPAPLSLQSTSLAPLILSAEMKSAPTRKSADIVVRQPTLENIGDLPASPVLTTANDFKGFDLREQDQFAKQAVWAALRPQMYDIWLKNKAELQQNPGQKRLQQKVVGNENSMNNIPPHELQTYMAKMENRRLQGLYDKQLRQHTDKAAKNNEMILRHAIQKKAAADQQQRRAQASKDFEALMADQQQRHATMQRDWDGKKLAQDKKRGERPGLELKWQEQIEAHMQRKDEHAKRVQEKEAKETARRERNAERARLREEHATQRTEQFNRREARRIAKEAKEAERLAKIEQQMAKGKAKREEYLQRKVKDGFTGNVMRNREKAEASRQQAIELARLEAQRQADELARLEAQRQVDELARIAKAEMLARLDAERKADAARKLARLEAQRQKAIKVPQSSSWAVGSLAGQPAASCKVINNRSLQNGAVLVTRRCCAPQSRGSLGGKKRCRTTTTKLHN